MSARDPRARPLRKRLEAVSRASWLLGTACAIVSERARPPLGGALFTTAGCRLERDLGQLLTCVGGRGGAHVFVEVIVDRTPL